MLCEAMSWAALPVAGGIYDQHPQLIEEWMEIFRQKSEHDRDEAEEQQQRMSKGLSRR